MKRFVTLALLLCVFGSAFAQKQRSWEYWRKPDLYLCDQTDVSLSLVESILVANPPASNPSDARRLALATIDAVTHNTAWDKSEQLHSFITGRLNKVIEDLDRPIKKKELRIYKLYNDGFIVRTSDVTIGFDICATRAGINFIPDSLIVPLVESCSALFISHKDPDHADKDVVAIALGKGIPVYAPEDCQITGVQGIRRNDFTSVRLKMKGGEELSVLPLPGHQDDLQNNIYVVSFPSGVSVAHCGDQWLDEDQAWLNNVSSRLSSPLDVLLIDCWAKDLKGTIEGFAPKLVVSGHENEIGHGIDHREALWLTQYKFDTLKLRVPCYVMTWGEFISYPKARKSR